MKITSPTFTSKDSDPILTASIYRSGALDEVIHNVIIPFRRYLEEDERDWLWIMRYSRGGEHLKIRVHGIEAHSSRLAGLLESIVRSYLSSAEPIAGASRMIRHDVPPIDAEDQAVGAQPDMSFLWTTYRRSPVSLAGKPLLLEDKYVALLTRCLGYGCDVVLPTFQLKPNGQSHYQPRQAALLRILITGLAALPAEWRAPFLIYHRDWLLRVMLVRSGADWEQGRDLLSNLDIRARSNEKTLETLRQASETQWGAQARIENSLNDGWRRSLSQLVSYVRSLVKDPAYHLDPFAQEPLFPVLFKAFHGLANQLGLDRLNEAYLHHLLLHAIGGATSGHGVAFIPEFAA